MTCRISKYHDLYVYLKSKGESHLKLTFDEIEKILGFKLPTSAYKYPAWWANGDNSHSHASSWQDAGYKVDRVLYGEYVIFSK